MPFDARSPIVEDDDEIFLGRLTLKEIRKRLDPRSRFETSNSDEQRTEEDSFHIITAKSEPDLTQIPEIKVYDSSSEVIDLCEDYEQIDLNNTSIESKDLVCDLKEQPAECYSYSYSDTNLLIFKDAKPVKQEFKTKPEIKYKTPIKTEYKTPKSEKKKKYATPLKQGCNKTDVFSTPMLDKQRTPVFKTPANPPSSNKKIGSAIKNTYPRNRAYDHVQSPIAFYIKNSAQVPLIQNVKATKPLAGASSIPVPVKTSATSHFNKENLELPKHAYMSSKNTVVNSASETMLPTKYAQKLMSSLPRPIIIRHGLRENVIRTKRQNQEDSFADLTLYQAETSVCTQKIAFS